MKYHIQFEIGYGYFGRTNPFASISSGVVPLVDIEFESEPDEAMKTAEKLLAERMQGKDYTILYWYWLPVKDE